MTYSTAVFSPWSVAEMSLYNVIVEERSPPTVSPRQGENFCRSL
jgi:hypothetical protein